jgi:transmembrane sensor
MPGESLQTRGLTALPVAVAAGQQLRVVAGEWPGVLTRVDEQRATAWLRRQIVFSHAPLGAVAAEFSRYSRSAIVIETPALRSLPVSGAFVVDDTESFLAFLRSLEGVRVEVGATSTRVWRE